MAVGIDAESAPSCAPTQFPFDAVHELSTKDLTKKWTGPMKFCSLPAQQTMIGSPPDKMRIAKVNAPDCLGQSKHPAVHRLCLDDPQKCNEPPLSGEPARCEESTLEATHSSAPSRQLPTSWDCPSCPMVAEVTFVVSSASFATVFSARAKGAGKERQRTSGS